MSNYAQEFTRAITRSKEFGLSVPNYALNPTRRWFDARTLAEFPYMLHATLGPLGLEDVCAQCLSIHHQMMAGVSAWLGCGVFYTLGWVDDGTEQGLFRFDDNFIAERIDKSPVGTTIRIHAWLTLPSMEIIDVTLPTTYGLRYNSPEMFYSAITRPADELRGLAYKPMLVGDAFLYRAGLIQKQTSQSGNDVE